MNRKISINSPIYISTGAKIWAGFCSAANLYVIITYIINGYFLYALPSLISTAGFLILWFLNSRWGFVITAGVSVFTVVWNFTSVGLSAMYGLLNPLLTWLIIRRDWYRPMENERKVEPGSNPYIIYEKPDMTNKEYEKDEESENAQAINDINDNENETEEYVVPAPKEDMAEELRKIDAALSNITAGSYNDSDLEYMISKGRIARAKIAAFVKKNINEKKEMPNASVLFDVVDKLSLIDNDDFYINLLVSEPYKNDPVISDLAAEALIKQNNVLIAEKLKECSADTRSNAVYKVLDYYK